MRRRGLLLPRLLVLDLGAMMSDHAACRGTRHRVVSGHVPRDRTHGGTLDTALGLPWSREQRQAHGQGRRR